jgi:hypothetical protein
MRREIHRGDQGNNQIDLFWASAPDAFEVLKNKKLLQKYQPKAQGIPKGRLLSGQRPGRLLFRLRRLGLRHHVERALRRANNLPEPKEWQDLAKPVYFDHVVDRRAVALGHHASDDRDDPAGRGLGQGLAHHQGNGRQLPQGHRALVRRARCGQFRPGRRRHRHRLLRLLGAGGGLPGEVRLSDRDDRSCRPTSASSPTRPTAPAARGLRRVPAVARRAGSAARADHPPPAGQPRGLRQGAGGLSQPVQGSAASRR